jgi:hypothetical protein
MILFNEQDIFPPRNGVMEPEAWNRPIHVLRHGKDTLCGYLELNATHVALQALGRPHKHQ